MKLIKILNLTNDLTFQKNALKINTTWNHSQKELLKTISDRFSSTSSTNKSKLNWSLPISIMSIASFNLEPDQSLPFKSFQTIKNTNSEIKNSNNHLYNPNFVCFHPSLTHILLLLPYTKKLFLDDFELNWKGFFYVGSMC